MINGIGILIGGANQLSLYFKKIILAFQARVVADSGIFESFDCMKSSLKTITKPLYEQASFVITPNAIKESKLYSVVPSDGSGDLSVVRATTATRVNSAGLIEEAPYNLVSYSEQFNNGYWGKFNSTIIANNTISPNGTLTADKLNASVSNLVHGIEKSPITGTNQTVTWSVFAKAGEYNFCGLSDNVTGQVIFNLITGENTFATPGLIANNSIYCGNGWWRLSVTFTVTTARGVTININTNGTVAGGIFSGTGTSGIYVWGGQLEVGANAKEYFPTTDRLNVPRLDYTNSTCPSILVEPQRTNLCLRSNDLTNAYYSMAGATIAQSSTDFLNGEKAFLFSETTANSEHFIATTSTISQLIGTTYTYSCYLKKGSGSAAPDIVRLRAFWGENYANFNISTGQVLSTSSQLTSASITPISNGYYRCSITWVGVTTGSTYVGVYFINNTNNLNGTVSYVGNVNANVFVAGWQYETGANATSYIPTTTATVTRNADVISKTGISSLIGQTEGTIVIKLSFDSITSTGTIPFALLGASNLFNNSTYLQMNTNGTLAFIVYRSSVFQSVLNSTSTFTQGQIINVAIRYKQNDFSLYINGVNEANSSSGNVSLGLQGVSFGISSLAASYNYNGIIKNVQLYKEKLTDTECIQLTTI